MFEAWEQNGVIFIGAFMSRIFDEVGYDVIPDRYLISISDRGRPGWKQRMCRRESLCCAYLDKKTLNFKGPCDHSSMRCVNTVFFNLINFLYVPSPKTCHMSNLIHAPCTRLNNKYLACWKWRILETEGQSNNYSQTLVVNSHACPQSADVDAASSPVTWDVSRCSNQRRCYRTKRGCKPSASEVRSKSFSVNETECSKSAHFQL